MEAGNHTTFMLDFVREFACGTMSVFDFELDYDGFVIEHFPGMEKENASFSKRFAAVIDSKVEFARTQHLSDEEFRSLILVGFNSLLSSRSTALS